MLPVKVPQVVENVNEAPDPLPVLLLHVPVLAVPKGETSPVDEYPVAPIDGSVLPLSTIVAMK